MFSRETLDGGVGAVDYFSFFLSEPKEVSLALRQQDVNADLFLEDFDGNVLGNSTAAGTAKEWIEKTLLSGTYYVRVEAQENGLNEYVFRYGVDDAGPAVVKALQRQAVPETFNVTFVQFPDDERNLRVGRSVQAEQEVILLVSNINKLLGVSGNLIDDTRFVSQRFTTGNYSSGYKFSKAVLKIEEASSTRVPVVSIYTSTGSGPGIKVYELNGSVIEAGDRTFTAPADAILRPDKSYFLHVAGGSGNGSFRLRPGTASSTGFDSSSLAGWSISTLRHKSDNGGVSWSALSAFHLRFSIHGALSINDPPVFSSSSSFLMRENIGVVGTVRAQDTDASDSITGYSISGGADSALFKITNGGFLSFKSAPNFESPGDSNRDNRYMVEVTATSGSDIRVMSANQSIAVEVTNVNEPPSAPAAPSLYSGWLTNLKVYFVEPDNSGPPITGYNVQYREGSSGSFMNWYHAGTRRGTMITRLNLNTEYQIRIRAVNGEGRSDWSPTASAVLRIPAIETESLRHLVAGDFGDSLVTGMIETSDDTDRFAVELIGGRSYRFEMAGTRTSHGLYDPSIKGIYDSDNRSIPNTSNDDIRGDGERCIAPPPYNRLLRCYDSRVEFTAGANGFYYVVVGRGENAGTGTYYLSAEDITPDVPADTSTSASVSIGGTVHGVLHDYRDVDWFAVSLVGGEVYRFDVESDNNPVRHNARRPFAFPWLSGIHDRSGDLITGTQDDIADGPVGHVFFRAPETGTYYVAVDPRNGYGDYYRLSARKVTNEFPFDYIF